MSALQEYMVAFIFSGTHVYIHLIAPLVQARCFEEGKVLYKVRLHEPKTMETVVCFPLYSSDTANEARHWLVFNHHMDQCV